MKQMTLKTFLLAIALFFTGWQSFAQGTIDSVYVLAGNKIQFSIPGLSTGDHVDWYLDGTPLNPTTGVTIEGADSSTLKIDGSLLTGFQQPADSLTAQERIISVVVYNAGGCYSEDTSKFYVLVLPYLKPMDADWTDSAALCMQNSLTGHLTATQPALTGAWSTVAVDDITWWNENTTTAPGTSNQLVDGAGGITISVSGTTSTLAFPTPTNTDAYQYWAQANYELPEPLVVSAANDAGDAQSISNKIGIQALPTPAAPVLNGSSNVTGW